MATAPTQYRSVIEPLSEASRSFLRGMRLNATDRLRVSMAADDDRYFVMKPETSDGTSAWWSLSDAARRYFWTRLPERRQIDHQSWRVAATDFNVLVTACSWPSEQIIFDDERARTVYDYLLARFMQQTHRAVGVARWRIDGEVPEVPDVALHPERPLSNCQRAALAAQLGCEGFGTFMEQGTGKTAVVVSRICAEARRAGKQFRVLVVCPKNVRTNWGDEFAKFATTSGAYAVLRGGQRKRVETMIDLVRAAKGSEWMAAIISYEGVIRSWEAIRLVEWDLCVLDESHFIKSPRARRTQHILTKLRDICDRRVALTGTPVCNSIMDLWAQLEWLGQGESGFIDYKRFREFYGRFERRGRFEKLAGFKNLPLMQERLARLSFFATKAEALPGLPDKLYDVVEVEMGDEQARVYEQLAEQLAAEIEADLANMEAGGRITVTNILTKLLRLAQITSGFVRFDDRLSEDGDSVTEGQISYFDPNPKIDALVDIVRGLGPKEKVIIWATFVSDIKQIESALTRAGFPGVTFYGATREAAREEAIRRFNQQDASECRWLCGNPAAGGVGVNLRGYDPDSGLPDHGCSCTRVVYYSQNWSHPQRSQSEDRAHRRGTRTPVLYTDLVVPGTIDEEIRARVTGKRTHALEVSDLRAILRSLRESEVCREDE